MPKAEKNPHEGIPYHNVPRGGKIECYQLHRPSKCRLKFPPTNCHIHKCELPEREYTFVPQVGGWRKLLIPKTEPNFYPAVMRKSDFEKLKQHAKKISKEEQLKAIQEQEVALHKAAKQSEGRKRLLKEKLQPQPGANLAEGVDPELNGPDQDGHTLTRAEMLQAENMQGPRLCNQVILASKCHAIRDAQLVEKGLIQKEIEEEEKRLDAIMEENRVAAVLRAEAEEKKRQELRLHNLAALKQQIVAHETAKVMEAERIEEESIRMNQANIAAQVDEAKKLKEKHAAQNRLKNMLDQGNAEILYYKQLQSEEERIMDKRVENFLKQRQEREMKARKEAEAVKVAKQKGIEHIAKAQKAEQELKEELERIRNLKIQEDVEREYRRKERDNAIKKHRELQRLHEARAQQIKDIHRTIAREIAKDEQSFNNAARQNEEFLRKEKELEEKHKAQIEKHRLAIMKQINDKERARADTREKIHNQGVALRLEQQQQEQYEKQVIKRKVAAMRDQKIPEKYVKEVEQTLSHLGYLK